jgi:ATP-dependent 26S proteasome regulatory subunit
LDLSHLDSKWIEDGLLKRKSNYSPVICIETTDPKRLFQLKHFLLTSPEGRETQNMFIYDPWEGLGRLVMSGDEPTTEPYKKRAAPASPLAQRVRQDDNVQLTQFKSVLKEVDPFLKSTRTVFILQNVSESREWETSFGAALRSWAVDPQVISKRSTVFILTSDVTSLLDEFTRELCVLITIDPSTREERAGTVEQIRTALGLDLAPTTELVMATAGLNLHQVESVLLESYYRSHKFDLVTIKDLKSELVKKSGVLEVRDPTHSFADIGGYDAIKSFIRKYVIKVLRQPQRAARFSLPLPKGILFFGPPGTGKSLFANALASEISLPFISLATENIYSKWLGESGQRMKSAIRMAEKMSPAIVFVDEIDRFGKRVDGAAGSAGEETKRVFSQFLEWLGKPDREAIIIGTTNVPEHLDEAFIRTGRFDYKIPFLYPGEAARFDIMRVHLGITEGSRNQPVPLAMDPSALESFLREDIAPLTRNFSGAEIAELVIRAKRVAFDRNADALEDTDFLTAVKTFRIDRQRRDEVIRECLEQARKFTDDQTFLDEIEREMTPSHQ